MRAHLLFLVVILLVASSQAQEPIHTLTSPGSDYLSFFGREVAGVPDTDGDGYGDILISSRVIPPGYDNVFLFSGIDGNLRHGFRSAVPLHDVEFGYDLDGIDDVTGDGAGDLVIGAWDTDDGEYIAAGRAYMFSGGSGQRRFTLYSPNSQLYGLFGWSVAGVPDVNGDGSIDLLIGAVGEHSGSGVEYSGRAYVFSGTTGTVLLALDSSQPGEDYYFGLSTSGSSDIDGDGRGELIVSEPYNPAGGRVFVFSGSSGTLLSVLSHPSPQPDDRFGYSVSGVPDADGDGWPDILVGAPGINAGLGGRAYLFSGATGALLLDLASPRAQHDGRFGWSVSGLPDTNLDGKGDLLIGTFDEEDGAGRAYLFSGADGALLLDMASPNPRENGRFGSAVSGVPDVNGDGRDDILIGARSEAVDGDGFAGRAYVFNGGLSAFTIAPFALDFGEVLVGAASESQEVVVENGTDRDLTLTSISVSGGDADEFEIVAAPQLPRTLPPGEVLSIEVRYAPGFAGAAQAWLRLEGGGGSNEVTLSGFGLAAENLTVTSAVDRDDGMCDTHCTLREAVTQANTLDDRNVITFSPEMEGRTIRLTLGVLTIQQPVHIDGGELGIVLDANGNDTGVFDFNVRVPGTLISGLTITGSSISRAIMKSSTGAVSIERCKITGNEGGGIWCNSGSMWINYSDISYNSAANGGGIYDNNSCSITITNSSLIGNRAGVRGGGIYNGTFHDDYDTIIRNTTISGNSAQYGGGIFSGWFEAPRERDGSRLGGNGTTILNGATVTNNNASHAGGGLDKGEKGDLEIRNSLIAGNTVGLDPSAGTADCIIRRGDSARGYSLVGKGTGCPTVATDVTVSPEEVFTRVLSPLLAYNGGSTRTHALVYAEDNPAIDLGGNCGPADQRGFPAPLDGPDADTDAACDAGAVEASSAVVLVPEDPPVVIPQEGGSFRFTFTLTNTTNQPLTTQVWTRATRPDGMQTERTLFGPVSVLLAPGETVSRALIQEAGPGVPGGVWTFTGFAGGYPREALASSGFVVTKEEEAARRRAAGERSEAEAWSSVRYADSGTPVAVGDVWTAEPVTSAGASALPEAYALHAARPNPLSARTTIGYDLPAAGQARLVVYDVLGRAVAVLADRAHEAGRHTVVFDARRLPSGSYLVRLETGETVLTRQVTVIR